MDLMGSWSYHVNFKYFLNIIAYSIVIKNHLQQLFDGLPSTPSTVTTPEGPEPQGSTIAEQARNHFAGELVDVAGTF